jgi:hypothetical protein
MQLQSRGAKQDSVSKEKNGRQSSKLEPSELKKLGPASQRIRKESERGQVRRYALDEACGVGEHL